MTSYAQAGADPGFFLSLGGGTPLRNGVADFAEY